MEELAGRVALVTGASRGIGAAIARALDAEGLRVVVHYRSSEGPARALAEKLADGLALRADLGVPEEIEALVAEIAARAGRVDVLVNNAGWNANGLMAAMKLADYDAVAAVTRGTWYLTKLVLRRFMQRSDVIHTGQSHDAAVAKDRIFVSVICQQLQHRRHRRLRAELAKADGGKVAHACAVVGQLLDELVGRRSHLQLAEHLRGLRTHFGIVIVQ